MGNVRGETLVPTSQLLWNPIDPIMELVRSQEKNIEGVRIPWSFHGVARHRLITYVAPSRIHPDRSSIRDAGSEFFLETLIQLGYKKRKLLKVN
jgi:hypothetical protein